ncbi:MAG TPA: CHAT domain-containing tetratricopeptide repeat protein [Candidatus Bathyarchaeia archaeon]|nr:CHAT domain-containing tetratricopeptide repeat protein [Candidatus Bathyarchaeia archaeon]
MMRTGLLMPTLASTVLVLALTAPADAQRGLGQGRGRPPAQPTPAVSAPGEYAFDGPSALEAINRGEGRQALAYYERTAKDLEQQGNLLRAARAGHAASFVAWRLGRYQAAIQAAGHALELFPRATGLTPDDQVAWSSSYFHLGEAYRAVGDLPKARQVLEDGLAFTRGSVSGRAEGKAEGFLLNSLARVALDQHDYQTALAQSTQAAQFFETGLGRLSAFAPEATRMNFRRWTANSYAGIGQAELPLGHPDKAEAAFARGLTYAHLSGLQEIAMTLLAGQGTVALSRGDWAKALGIYQQAIALANQIQSSGNLPYLYQGQTRALVGQGRSDDALASSREALRYVEELRADLGDAGLRVSFFEDKQAIYELAVQLALEGQHPEEAFSLAERSRSRTFLDLLGSQTTLSKGRTRALVDEEVRLRARLAEARAEAQGDASSVESHQARARIAALDQDYRAFLERVRKESREQASLMAVEPASLSEIQGLLPEGTTLLEYLVGERDLAVWIVERQRFSVVRVPGDRQSLVAQVRQFRTAITTLAPLAEIERQAEALYGRLVAPARAEIRGSRVVIVPHGVLHYLPFPALRSPNGRWVVEDFAVSTLPSASVLRYLAGKGTAAPAKALVMGNPDLGAELALPWAEREARMVGQRERDATVLVRGDATEAQAKQLLGSVGLIHFATHGELNESDPLSSAVLLVPGGGEDGRLEVREVFGLDLRARLVVLSACETGLGKLSSGDELVGLQRAFLYAGTPAVVTTLWKVDDRASYELVRAFYQRLDTAGPLDALREAQLETQRIFPHPFSWAAFGLAGVPR